MVGSAIPGQVSLLLYKIAEQTRRSKPVFVLWTLPPGSCLRFPQRWNPSKWVLISVSHSSRKVNEDGRRYWKMCRACSHVDFLQEKAR